MSSKYDRCVFCKKYIEQESRVASPEYEGYACVDCYMRQKHGGSPVRSGRGAHTSNLGHAEVGSSTLPPRSTNGKLFEFIEAMERTALSHINAEAFRALLHEMMKELEHRLQDCNTEKAYIVYRDFFKEYFGEQK